MSCHTTYTDARRPALAGEDFDERGHTPDHELVFRVDSATGDHYDASGGPWTKSTAEGRARTRPFRGMGQSKPGSDPFRRAREQHARRDARSAAQRPVARARQPRPSTVARPAPALAGAANRSTSQASAAGSSGDSPPSPPDPAGPSPARAAGLSPALSSAALGAGGSS